MNLDRLAKAYTDILGATPELDRHTLFEPTLAAWHKTPDDQGFHDLFWSELAPTVYEAIAAYDRERKRRHRLVYDADGAQRAEAHLAGASGPEVQWWTERFRWLNMGRDIHGRVGRHDQAAYDRLEPCVERFAANDTANRLVRHMRNPREDAVIVLQMDARRGVECRLRGVPRVGMLHMLLADRVHREPACEGWLDDRAPKQADADVFRGTVGINGYAEMSGFFDIFAWTNLVETDKGLWWRPGPYSTALSWTDEIGMIPRIDGRRVLIVRPSQSLIRLYGGQRAAITDLRPLPAAEVERWFAYITRESDQVAKRRADVAYHFRRFEQYVTYDDLSRHTTLFVREVYEQARALPEESLRLAVTARYGWAAHFFDDMRDAARAALTEALGMVSRVDDVPEAALSAYRAMGSLLRKAGEWDALAAHIAAHGDWVRAMDPAESAFVHRMLALGVAKTDPTRAAVHARAFLADATPLLGEGHPNLAEIAPIAAG